MLTVECRAYGAIQNHFCYWLFLGAVVLEHSRSTFPVPRSPFHLPPSTKTFYALIKPSFTLLVKGHKMEEKTGCAGARGDQRFGSKNVA